MLMSAKGLSSAVLTSFMCIALVQACAVDIYEDEKDKKGDEDLETCPEQEDSENACPLETKEEEKENEFGFLPNCQEADCEVINIGVIYDLDQEIEENRTVIVEAYKNPRFLGNPVAASWKSRFNTKESRDIATQIYLAPGVYYLRAYLTKPGDTPKPHNYRRMQLSRRTPTGIYGALSGIEQLIVTPEPQNAEHYVEIYIDELYEDSNQNPEVETGDDESETNLASEK